MRASTSPASSFGGRPKRTAARFAFAAGIFFKVLVFIAFNPGSAPLAFGGASQFMQITSACKQNETVSFLLTSRLERVIWPIETERFRFFCESLSRTSPDSRSGIHVGRQCFGTGRTGARGRQKPPICHGLP